MNRNDEDHETRSGQESHRRQQEQEYCKYTGDEFEQLEAEAEASVEYNPEGTYRRMSIKTRRTRASLQRSTQPQNGRKSEEDGNGDPGRRNAEFPQRSRIPTSSSVRQKASLSSLSLQLELQTKKTDLALVRNRISSQYQPAQKTSVIQQRLNSANEIQIKDLTSKVRLLENSIQDLTAENRTLKSGFQRQAVALQKYEGAESDFPRVLTYHQNEVKYLQQSLRKTQSDCRKYEAMMRDANKRIFMLEDQNGRLQKLVETDELDERTKLQRQVIEMSQQIAAAQETLHDHNRQFELLQKSHTRQLGTVESKLKVSDKRVFDAEQELYRLTELIRQKDRVISYLRMRSRNPGLEPPLHRKVMEEHKSSYKYFYNLVEESSGSNQGSYYPQNTNSFTPYWESPARPPPNDESYGSVQGNEAETHEPITHSQNPSTSQTVSTVGSSGEGDGIVYSRSIKSGETCFSDDLAQRSRERNLDNHCSGSEFDDAEEQDTGEGRDSEGEDHENYHVERLTGSEPMTADMQQDGGPTGGSATTYAVFKNCEDESDPFEGFPFEGSLESDNHHGYFETMDRMPMSNSPENRIRPKRPVTKDPDRLDTEPGFENGAGDAGRSPFVDKRDYMVVYPDHHDGEESMSDEEPAKYSEEEFYCESAGENESRKQTPVGTNSSRWQDTNEDGEISPSSSPPRPVAPVKSGLLPLDNKYFTFTSKPTAGKSFTPTPPHSSEVSRRGTSQGFYKTPPMSPPDFPISHFYQKRPKDLELTDEFPSGTHDFQFSGQELTGSPPTTTDLDPDELYTDGFWSVGEPTFGNQAESQRRDVMGQPLLPKEVGSKKKVSPSALRNLSQKQPPFKQPIKNRSNRFTTF